MKQIGRRIIFFYNGLTTLLKFVAASSDAFAPLKSITSGLDWIKEWQETVAGNKEDLAQLAKYLDDLSFIRRYGTFNPSSNLNSLQEELVQNAKKMLEGVEARRNHGTIAKNINALADADFIRKSLEEIKGYLAKFQTRALFLIGGSLEDFKKAWEEETTFGKLPCVAEATFTAQTKNDGCLLGTRVDVLNEILAWAANPTEPSVYWLCGMAGTGKSTIAQTVCERLDKKGLLGGSFFCSQQASPEQANVTRIIPTLATLIARKSQPYRSKVLTAMTQIPGNEMLKLPQQFEQLLSTPIQSVFRDSTTPFVLVIDALDECDDPDATRNLLTLILENIRSLNVKFFVASRPEERIREEFLNMDPSSRSILQLHNIKKVTVDGDVRTYLSAKLRRREKRDHEHPEELWPSEDQLDQLVNLCGQLFIYASTTCYYIKERTPKRRLEGLLADGKLNAERGSEPIDLIYNHILAEAFSKLNNKEVSEAKTVLAAIVYVYEPLSVRELGALLDLDVDNIRDGVSGLHSVISVPDKNEGVPVTTIHFSFVEYIKDSTRSGSQPWFLSSSDAHCRLAHNCFTLLNSKLHFNISQCETSYFENDGSRIAMEIVYASQFVFEHLCDMAWAPLPDLLDMLEYFFRNLFLYWLEVMRYVALKILEMLEEYLSKLEVDDRVMDLVRDARGFMIEFSDPIWSGAAHIYLSALAFAHPSSLITASYLKKFPNLPVVQQDTGNHSYSKPMLKIKAGPGFIRVAMSPNGDALVSAVWGSANVWDTRSGNSILKLVGHKDSICSITFSPDGKYIASASNGKNIRIWNAATGTCKHELTGPSDKVSTVAFSPDGNFIVSESWDGVVIVWDIHSGEHRTWEGHNRSVFCAAFSPDGSLIVSGDADGGIRLCNVSAGELLRTFKRLLCIDHVAFLADNRRFAFVSHDELGMYDSQTGTLLHCWPISSEYDLGRFTLSPDGTRAAFCGYSSSTIDIWSPETGKQATIATNEIFSHLKLFNDEYIVAINTRGYICVWDAKQLEQIPVETHSASVTLLTFSPDASLLASLDIRNVLRVWQSGTGNLVSKFSDNQIGEIEAIVFSSDGQLLLSAHSGGQLRQWNVNTGQSIHSQSFSEGNSDKEIYCAAFSGDAAYLAIGYRDSRIRLIKTDDLTDINFLEATDPVSCVALSSDGTRVAYGSGDTVSLADIKGTQIVPLKEFKHDHSVKSLVLSEDGSILLSASSSSDSASEIHIRNVATGIHIATTSADDTPIALAPTGEYLATGHKDGGIDIWDVANESLSQTVYSGSPYDTSIPAIVFSPDGTRIAYGLQDGTIEVSVIGQRDKDAKLADMQKHCHHIPPHPPLFLSSDPTHGLMSTCDLFDAKHNPTEHETDSDGDGWIYSDDDQSSFSEATDFPQAPQSLNKFKQLPSFYLDEYGWVCSTNQKQILWIPHTHRRHLCFSEKTVIMGTRRLNIDLSRFRHGKSWTECKA